MPRRLLAALSFVCLSISLPAIAAPQASLLIPNGSVSLAASLKLPKPEGRFPALVLVPGSGCETRGMLADHADILVSLGVAVLTYDKRGCGQSTGDWTSSSLDDLVSDAVAAVSELRKQE